MWYDSVSDLLRDETNDRFPPRFRLKMVNKHCNLSEMNLVYKYKICVKSKRKEDKQLTLIISGFGRRFLNKGW